MGADMAATGEMPGATGDAVALLWERRTATRRGPRPTLTLAAIASAGIEIADADGLSAVTMQRVAAALGVTKMALYRYVPGKVELVALMIDIGIGPVPRLADAAADDWRARLDGWSRQMFGKFLRHPWSLEVTVGARAIGPNELGWMEEAVDALAATGLEGGEMLDVVATLAGHARAMAQQLAATPGANAEQAMGVVMAGLLRGREEQFPALAAAFSSAAAHGTQDRALDFGLTAILDGVGLLIADRATAAVEIGHEQPRKRPRSSPG
jgi:AcrR family transcriptional regulator